MKHLYLNSHAHKVLNINHKRIFTFWEPKANLPAYLKLCMQTWQKFLPEYEIVVLDYSNLDNWLGKNFFDKSLFKNFSLPKQADAIRCAVLKKYGGIWMDCDTIITTDNVKEFLSIDSSFVLIGNHIGFIKATQNADILNKWLSGLYFRINFYKQYNKNSLLSRALLWIKSPLKYKKTAKKLENWDFLGNGILRNLLKKSKQNPRVFFSIDKQANNIFPELLKYGEISMETYQKFYFENDFSKKCFENTRGIILLHNSWTPKKYLAMDEKLFLSQKNTISSLLMKILNLK